MSNIAKVLREEISRISRHEAKVAITPIRKSTSKLKPDIADLKNRMADMEKEIKRLNLLAINLASTQPAPTPAEEPERRAWTSGKGVESLSGGHDMSAKLPSNVAASVRGAWRSGLVSPELRTNQPA